MHCASPKFRSGIASLNRNAFVPTVRATNLGFLNEVSQSITSRSIGTVTSDTAGVMGAVLRRVTD
jgi:hypothetical protein